MCIIWLPQINEGETGYQEKNEEKSGYEAMRFECGGSEGRRTGKIVIRTKRIFYVLGAVLFAFQISCYLV